MWTRKDLKSDAKDFLFKNLKNSIIICLIFYIISGLFTVETTLTENLSIYINNKATTLYNEEFNYNDIEEEFSYYDLEEETLDNDGLTFLDDENLKNGKKGILVINFLGDIGNDLYSLGGTNLSDNVNINFFSAMAFVKLSSYIIAILAVILILLRIFIVNPLTVGLNSFFLKGYSEEPKINYLFTYFKNKTLVGLAGKILLKNIYLFLWSLLLIIPGIIKTYQYYYVDFILAENPEMSLNDAIALSKEMTNGEKFDIFVLDLSFFGWALLSVLSFNLGSLILNPYIFATKARLYLFKKEQHEQIQQQEQFNYYNEINNNY